MLDPTHASRPTAGQSAFDPNAARRRGDQSLARALALRRVLDEIDRRRLAERGGAPLHGAVGFGRENRPDDLRLARRRLAALGYAPALTTWQDLPFFDPLLETGLRAFQAGRGLPADGWMRPDGETERAIVAALAGRPQPAHRQPSGGLTDPFHRPTDPFAVDRDSLGRPFPSRPGAQIGPQVQDARARYGVKLAGKGKAIRSLIQSMLGASAAGAIGSPHQGNQGLLSDRSWMEPSPSIPSSPPPHAPLDESLTNPRPQGRPLDPPTIEWGTTLPILEPNKPQILIFPDISDEIAGGIILEIRRERPETKAQIDALIKYYESKGWEHLAGGRDDKGKEKKERHIPGPGYAFLDEKGRHGDGRPGSVRPDMTFKTPSGKIVHVQTVDVDRNGKPKARELDNAERLRRATGEDVILIPKTWQLERMKRRE